jgi:Tol biopolymer transport system component
VSLAAGSRLGPYEILSPLGAGGMGEVWLARDGRLWREVAIKVLPAAFAADAERLARFRREAQVLAALNHPHIAAIHGLEESGGVEALVLELVPGETLAERLTKGPIPIEEALEIARQIADGLAAAHERGIVHRDLKPANVKITPEGKVKILDFGLAKALTGDISSPDVSTSPTVTAAATQAGVVIGTASYMSPEQARGKSVDKRADVWAFGAVLYEMLTGRRAFAGETVSDTLAAVLRADIDWRALPAETPASVRRGLRLCLERDRDRRIHDITDARLEMDETGPLETGGAPAPASARPAWRAAVLFAAGALLAAAVTWLATRPKPPAPEPVRRFTLTGLHILIDGRQSIALSPDGRSLVYRGRGDDGFDRLYLRSLDSTEAQPLPGTEQGALPFFSPDSEWVGFFAGGNLRKVDLGSGSPQTLCRTGGGAAGGTWLSDGTIIFVGDPEAGLQRVPAQGGTPEVLTKPDPKTGEGLVVTPWALPESRGVLVAMRRANAFGIGVYSLERRELKPLPEEGFTPTYFDGHILFQQGMGATLLAIPFDARRLEATGPPFPTVSSVGTRISFQARTFSVSENGTLAYLTPRATLGEGALLWIDRNGAETPIAEMPGPIDAPRLSPDGRRIAFRAPAPNCDVWIYDLERQTSTRLTIQGDNHGVVWTPDGKGVAFARADAPRGIVSGGLAVDLLEGLIGGGNVKLLAPHQPGDPLPTSFSPDGRLLLCGTSGGDTVGDIEVLDLGARPERRVVVKSPFDESQAVFSSDGRYIAYVSGESGRQEVYVQPYPALDSRVQVSSEGGVQPVWSRNGKELFFRQGRAMMAVEIRTTPAFVAGRPRKLFEGGAFESPSNASYDVSADGQRFLVVRGRTRVGDPEIEVVLGWSQELRRSQRRVPAR